jgi:cell division septation protein DedD
MLVIGLAAATRADEVADKALALNKEGTSLAEQGRFDDAIVRFKAAEVLLPRYQHHCNIGIAYQDSGRLPQAQRFLQSCVARAGKNASPAVKARLSTVEAALRGPTFGVLVVKGASVRVAFAPAFDETWVVDGQRRFPLSGGPVDLAVSSLAGATWSRRVDVAAGQETLVDLGTGSAPLVPAPAAPAPTVEATPEPTPVLTPTPAPAPAPEPATTAVTVVTPASTGSPRALPWVLLGGGAGLAGLGVATFFAAQAVGRSLGATDDLTGYRTLFFTTYIAWGLGAVSAATGLVLALLQPKAESALIPLPVPGGLVVGWSGRFGTP